MSKDRCRTYDQLPCRNPRFCTLPAFHPGPHNFVEGRPISQEMRDRLNGIMRGSEVR